MWKVALCALGLLISLSVSVLSQEGKDAKTEGRLFYRFESGISRYRLEESLIGLADAARQPGAMLVVRICSNESMPKALVLSAASPHIVYDYMSNSYNYPRGQIRVLRSEDCLGEKSAFAATELWVVPKDGEIPSSVESVDLSQVTGKTIESHNKIKTRRQFRAALQRLIKTLREQPDSVGIVNGYYFNRPSPSMVRALEEAKELLKRSKLPASQ